MKLRELFETTQSDGSDSVEYADYEEWQEAVKARYPGLKFQFKNDPKNHNIISAIVGNFDCCYGDWHYVDDDGNGSGRVYIDCPVP